MSKGQVIGVDVGFDGLEIRDDYRDDRVTVSSATDLEVSFDHTFLLLLQVNQVSGRR
jgi:hypothetical protein